MKPFFMKYSSLSYLTISYHFVHILYVYVFIMIWEFWGVKHFFFQKLYIQQSSWNKEVIQKDQLIISNLIAVSYS